MSEELQLKLGECYSIRKGLSTCTPISIEYAILIDMAFFVEDLGHNMPFIMYYLNR